MSTGHDIILDGTPIHITLEKHSPDSFQAPTYFGSGRQALRSWFRFTAHRSAAGGSVSAKRGAMEIHKCQRITGVTWELVMQMTIGDGLVTPPGLLSSSLFLKLASEAVMISFLI